MEYRDHFPLVITTRETSGTLPIPSILPLHPMLLGTLTPYLTGGPTWSVNFNSTASEA